jgi:ComF family protein
MIRSFLKTIFQNVFPHVCLHCNNHNLSTSQLLCVKCLHEVPFTHQEKINNNEVERIFWGRVPLQKAFALAYFNKGNIVQQLIHKLKYRNNTHAGLLLGKLMGQSILKHWQNTTIDYIVPVPLHITKESKRGYNQAYIIAKGIAEVLDIPVITHNLIRLYKGNSQTKLSRIERWHTVANMFAIKNSNAFANKHILLVDDTLTTGATLEACARPLIHVKGLQISIAAAAYVNNN